MRIRTTLKTGLLATVATLLLAGCAKSPDELNHELAERRAAVINSKAPYPKVDQYQIMKAKARQSIVEITILYGGGGKTSPTKAAQAAAESFCTDPELTPMVSEGLGYLIEILDMRGRPVVQQPINAQFCQQIAPQGAS
ncbi:type II secretion system pilot lipoprotein GspS-beta [Photobacterium sp. 1_MG-2023]|uniref:type II secretion system pilot lipoprotein GspS-beta n=1 Tax=Photobacterium sp. 1_MG-2023 TaxID=3062646 RepID=UPI0026E22A3C|nr:type II secretion system pilot lipoprotein GspS-beta [Photobacterium sp. 1_MG-2023]MDO6706545.1 type II secretion system pilot lipoprotein GspS-beta [Photobacterium sp. 1_MG-2023]